MKFQSPQHWECQLTVFILRLCVLSSPRLLITPSPSPEAILSCTLKKEHNEVLHFDVLRPLCVHTFWGFVRSTCYTDCQGQLDGKSPICQNWGPTS